MVSKLEVTTKVGCPLNCRACPQSLFIKRYLQKRPWESETLEHRPMILSFADFKTCMNKLPASVLIAFAAFGEPQTNPAFADMVLYAHSLGHPIELYSTLVGMTKESYEKIRTVPFKAMVLHIPDRDGNSHFTISEEYLKLVNLVLADAAVGRFRITGYSCHGPVHPLIADIFKKNSLPVPVTAFGNLNDRAGNLKDADVRHSAYVLGPIFCRTARRDFNQNVLLPDGTVCLCCMDFGMDYILGNLLTQSYEEIMQGDVLQKLRHCMKSEKNGDCLCRHCAYAMNRFIYAKYLIRRTISRLIPKPVKRLLKK